MRWTTIIQAAVALSAAVMLSACGSKSTDSCKTKDDCGVGQTCNTDKGVCEDIQDLCAARQTPCPGAQTCDPQTGQCTGTCCTDATCPDPRTTCNEDRCLAGDGQAACEEKTCDDPNDPNRGTDPAVNDGCKDGFKCNKVADPPVCELSCLTDGCPDTNETCDPPDPSRNFPGGCEVRLPTPDEVGAPCTQNSDCGPGLTCITQIPRGYCSKACNADSECPIGTFCDQICWDACNVNIGDCPRDQQCVSFDSSPSDYCFPVFDQSECTSNCLPNGSPCDPNVPDQCENGAACVDFSSGAMCMSVSCHLGLDPISGDPIACGTGETCQGLGAGLTGCLVGCDPKDPMACQDLSNKIGTSYCSPSPQIESSFDTYFVTDDLEKCAGTNMPDGKEFSDILLPPDNKPLRLCTASCQNDGDCNPGQFCDEVALTLSINGTTQQAKFNACTNYNVKDSVTCADNPCGNHACTDLTLGAGQGTAVVCYDACTADSECTAASPGGTCNRLAFGTGDAIDICLYDTEGAICFFGCQDDADCGYCVSDADCPQVSTGNNTTRQQVCDLASHTCQTPITGVAEVNQICRSGQVYWASAIQGGTCSGDNDCTASTGGVCNNGTCAYGGCATPCDVDIECAGQACVADTASPKSGFCAHATTLCNGPTGQCEEVGCTTNAECYHNLCLAGAGPLGENQCLAACQNDNDCGPGKCDTSLGYCVDTLQWNLTVQSTGLTSQDDGKTVYLSVRDKSTDAEVTSGSMGVANATFTMTWNDILLDGSDYYVDLYIDDDSDQACMDANDRVYRIDVLGVSTDTTVTADFSAAATETPAACGSF